MVVSDDLRRRIHQEHRKLHVLQDDLLERFESYCENPAVDRHAELVRVLDDFRVSVRRHFDFEETGGYLKVVTDKRPQHAGRVEALRSEHGEILTLLDRLYDEVAVHAQGDLPGCSDFNDDFVALVRQFGRHEQAERELVMDVFWLEGGVSD